MADLFSIFVDNLPRDMDAEWLRQIFTTFGSVVDVYIPSKRSSTFNTKFGFIRFKRKEEATKAIDALNGILIRNFSIRVQFAKFSKSAPSRSYKNNQGGVSLNLDSTAHRWKPILSGAQCNQRNSYPNTYADILRGEPKGMAKMVEVKESGLDWLLMSAVGTLKSYCDVNSLQDLFITNGIWDAHIRSLGGLNVLLSFDSSESLNSFLEDQDSVLPRWFSSIEAWANQSIKPSRCVWISCFGVPLNAWCSSTFINIGKLWGDVVKLDEFTENSIAFDKGRMFILTDLLDCINEVVHIKIDDVIYPVKVIEDPIAETCWEKRVFTSIKINRKLDSDGKENVVEIDPLDDDSIELGVLDGQEQNIGVDAKMDLPELGLDNKHYLSDDLGLCDGSRDEVFEKESVAIGVLAHVLSDSPNTESFSITSPIFLSRPKMNDMRDELCTTGENSESVEKQNSHEKFLGANLDDSSSIDKEVSRGSEYDDWDLISNEPLIKYVECKRLKKTQKSKKDCRRKTLWSKNPLKTAMFSRTVSRDSIRKVSRLGSKNESFNGSIDGPTHSIHEEVSSVFHKRNSILIKEARENMKMSVRLGVKYHGRESYNIKKLLELKGIEISEQEIKAEIKALDILEGDASLSMEF